MRFSLTPLSGAVIVELDPREDDRGFFARSFCVKEFEAAGLNASVVQCNVSRNKEAGTLRGMHFQIPPFAEVKLVRVTKGAIYDVIVDLRPGSPTFTKWFGIDLNEENHTALYVPLGFAHGFLTLTDETEIFYQMSNHYSPEHARGFRYNDPAFEIAWPRVIKVVTAKDEQYRNFRADDAELQLFSR